MIKVAVAQIAPVVGQFEVNIQKIKIAYQRACQEQARILLTPELGICGYPPYDLIDRPEMIERNEKAVWELAQLTQSEKCALLVGHVGANPSSRGRPSQNFVSVLEAGKVVFRQAKSLLPTYDVFDEARYFEPSHSISLWECDGYRIAIAICEDLWGDHQILGRHLYGKDPLKDYLDQKADLVLACSSSPYSWEKQKTREEIHQGIAKRLKCPLIYVNQIGATDEILFDGNSFAFNQWGECIGRLPSFQTSFGVIQIESNSVKFLSPSKESREDNALPQIEVLARGLVVGIQEYLKRTGFKKVIIGLSGGIDSAVVGTLAVKALGASHVMGIAMPSQYSSSHSLEDAEILAKNLGISFEVRPIKFLFSIATRELSERRGQLTPIALENLQSRLRGLILMTLSNHEQALVLTTGNKSEFAMGYCTLYGDMVGALAPIGDLLKTRVYEVAKWMNSNWGNPIPERSITKAPSAELRPNQTDQDSLPPYDILDEFLMEYLENNQDISSLEQKFETISGHEKGWVKNLLKKLQLNEYKRKQAAPILKISPKAFGIGRRIPLAKEWN